MNQPPWREGGGVNAIERSAPVLAALGDLSADWAVRDSKAHPLLGLVPRPAHDHPRRRLHLQRPRELQDRPQRHLTCPATPTTAATRAFPAPRSCSAVEAAAAGRRLARRATRRSGPRPPTTRPPRSTPARTSSTATRAAGRRPRPRGSPREGIDTTYDGALLTRLAGVPSPAFGPGDLGRAHAPDEWVGVDELVLGARAYARAICAWCGTSPRGR